VRALSADHDGPQRERSGKGACLPTDAISSCRPQSASDGLQVDLVGSGTGEQGIQALRNDTKPSAMAA
jgi:hypothetical protein